MAEHRTFVDAAVRAGISHLVYISFFGASPTATFTLARDHWDTEEHIKQSGMNYALPRDNVYADLRYSTGCPRCRTRGPSSAPL